MKLRTLLIAASATASALTVATIATPAAADDIVATIVGAYDKDIGDSPELDITNSSGGSLTNIQLVLKGYQGLNNNVVNTVNLGAFSIADGTTYDLTWGGTLPYAGDLTVYDYDDEKGGTTVSDLCVVGLSLCSYVGNFAVTLTATIAGGAHDGQSVFSQFSPNNNFSGGFVGWEGLDQNGLSETTYDDHNASFHGTMAVIRLGAPDGGFNPNGVPEPATWALMMVGFGALGSVLRQRRAPRAVA